jgi:hypothetical protein
MHSMHQECVSNRYGVLCMVDNQFDGVEGIHGALVETRGCRRDHYLSLSTLR